MTLTLVALASATAALSLRPDAPALSLDVAEASRANVLADRILSPGHRAILEAFVHPANMDAPVAWVTRIDLVEQPTLDCCRADVIDIEFEPTQAQHPSGFRPSPTRPTSLTVQNFARLAAADPPESYYKLDLVRRISRRSDRAPNDLPKRSPP